MMDFDVRRLRGGRHDIIGESPRAEAAVRAIIELLIKRRAQRIREAASDLTVRERGVEQPPGVMDRDIFVDPHAAGVLFDLHAAQIEDEAVGGRGIDFLQRIGRGKPRRRPEGRLAQGWRNTLRQRALRPVRGPGEPPEGQRFLRGAGAEDAAALEPHVGRGAAKLGRGDFSEPPAQTLRREMSRAGHRARETARIIAAGDRPGVAGRVQLGDDANIARFKAKLAGDGLGQHGPVPLPLRQEET